MKCSKLLGAACFGVLFLPLSAAHAQKSSEQEIIRLRKLLKNPNDEVRVKAAKDIAELGIKGASAVNDLVDLLEKDKEPGVRIAAVTAIRSIYFRGELTPPGAKAIKALSRALRSDS